jgi:hypothetical protein
MAKRVTGKKLNKEWGVNVKHPLYHRHGNWYHLLMQFPAALFDPNGYIVFKNENHYRNCKALRITKAIHVNDGISAIQGYVRKRKQAST